MLVGRVLRHPLRDMSLGGCCVWCLVWHTAQPDPPLLLQLFPLLVKRVLLVGVTATVCGRIGACCDLGMGAATVL